MPNGHHTQGGRRDAPSRYEDPRQDPRHHDGRTRAQSGGRSESFAHERDREQREAGYAPRDWSRGQEAYRTVHSEPDWDPSRIPHDREFDYDRAASAPRDQQRRAHYGDEGNEFEQRRMSSAPHGSRQSSPEFEYQYRHHDQSLASEIGNAARRMVGKVERLVRNPKNYTRSDERIREDVCDRLSVSQEVDPSDIEVSVTAGEVTLTGTVTQRQMKFAAEEIADSVVGVHDVHNQLRVNRPAPPQTSSNVSINSQEPGRGGKNIGRS
jgi:hypothetical protein